MPFVELNFFYIDTAFTEVATKGPIDDKPSFVQVMAWCQAVNKLWPDLMLTEVLQYHMVFWGLNKMPQNLIGERSALVQAFTWTNDD